jgi:thioredoxin 1
MTTKKAVLIAVGIIGALVLIVALVAGSILGFVFYTLDHSDAAQTAKTFLRENAKLTHDIGEVRDFGYFTSGSINSQSAMGDAELHLKTFGAQKTVNATVLLATREGREWRVVDAFYVGDDGQRVYLTKNFDAVDTPSQGDEDSDAASEHDDEAAGNSDASGEPEKFDEENFKANVLESKTPVLVVLSSPTSPDSRELDDAVQTLASKYEEKVDLVEYNLSEQPELSQRFNVKGIPTVIVFNNGVEQERRAGKLSAEELSRLLDKYLQK